MTEQQNIPENKKEDKTDNKKEDENDLVDFTATLKRKKKKKKAHKITPAKQENADDKQDARKEYTYLEMLNRLFIIMENDMKMRGDDKPMIEIDPPEVSFLGTKKTVWANFRKTAKILSRSTDHIMTFFATEMGTHTSIDKKGRMIIKGRLQPHNIERPLNSYINQYVKCHMCRKYTTHFKKDPNTRLLFLECDLCGSSRSVNQIRSLYHATSRADRIQAKKAAAS